MREQEVFPPRHFPPSGDSALGRSIVVDRYTIFNDLCSCLVKCNKCDIKGGSPLDDFHDDRQNSHNDTRSRKWNRY